MGYSKLPTKAWKDPLGPNYLGYLRSNINHLQHIAGAEHIITTGEHNAIEIPRVVRTIASTSVLPSSTDITSVSNPSTGKYVLTLASGRFDADDIRVQFSPFYIYPAKCNYKVNSDTEIEVYTFAMTAGFSEGAGNVWALTDMPFCVAIHSAQLDAGAWSDLSDRFTRGFNGGGFIGNASWPTPSWTGLVQAQADVQRVLLGGHTAAGNHNTREVAIISGLFTWNGSSYDTESSTVDSWTRNDVGDISIYWADASTYHHSFISDLGNKLMSCPLAVQASTTSTRCFLYRYNGGEWEIYDGPFFVVSHGSV